MTIYKAGGYTLVSHGNGWAYTMTHPSGLAMWLQDGDAAAFRAEMEALPNTWPVLAVLREMASRYEAAFNREGPVT